MEHTDDAGAVVYGAILLKDHQLGRNPFGGPPSDVSRGELLVRVQGPNDDHHSLYMLRSEPKRTCLLDETDVAPLNSEEFNLLEAISMPCDRFEAFKNNKLEWATKLKAGTAMSSQVS